MILLLAGLALAAPTPDKEDAPVDPAPTDPGLIHVEVDALLGMRAGLGGVGTWEPRRHLELGGLLTVVTDLYAFSPGWVREGLEPRHNLRVAPQAVFGVNTGRNTVSLALLGSVGLELLSFREQKTLPALDEPVVYGTTELVPVGGLSLDLRVVPSEHWGGNLLIYLPLPFSPTGTPNIERAFGGLGVTWRR